MPGSLTVENASIFILNKKNLPTIQWDVSKRSELLQCYNFERNEISSVQSIDMHFERLPKSKVLACFKNELVTQQNWHMCIASSFLESH